MASEEFLVRFRYWLVSGGMMIRSACGTTTRRRNEPAQAERRRRLGLALADTDNAGAHDLGDERRGVEGQGQKSAMNSGMT